jgi:butyryl-CoA dehydrogenase
VRQTLDFLLNDWLQVDQLLQRTRFADHSLDTFGQVLDVCERIAATKFAPFNRLVDTQEPHFDSERVHLPQATHDALAAYVESGMLAAAQDYEYGGMQLPCVVEMAANAFFSRGSVSMGGYAMLTSGNASLLMAHGTPVQREVFAKTEFSGRWFGTMCLSEPQAGSSLSDVATRAVPDGDDFQADRLGPRYRLRGNKMWISGGEHEITENIIHLVLAKIPGPDGKPVAGTRGISLFIVPKHLVDAAGELSGGRNDVALAGLNHKLGYRGTTNTLLNFGEGKYPVGGRPGAVGYLVGKPGDGLRCMFHMMNEARIGVGLGAVMLGYAGYEASLDYARQRPQGRHRVSAGKDATRPQVAIIEHADVKRMLLAQKAYVEGGLALALYCARLVDELHTGDDAARADAERLLEVLTPIAKSWPSEWCLEANSLAIQVHGGYGYTRDFPVEQLWRDNRLNMITRARTASRRWTCWAASDRETVVPGLSCWRRACARRSTARAGCRPGRAGRAPGRRTAGAARRHAVCVVDGEPDEALATPRPTCKPSATSCWPGCGWTSRWPPPPRLRWRRQARGDAVLFRLRAAEDRCLASVVSRREPLLREMQDEWF